MFGEYENADRIRLCIFYRFVSNSASSRDFILITVSCLLQNVRASSQDQLLESLLWKAESRVRDNKKTQENYTTCFYHIQSQFLVSYKMKEHQDQLLESFLWKAECRVRDNKNPRKSENYTTCFYHNQSIKLVKY